ncbi:MAG: hypothetical protein WC764_00310 [Candidatus Paceibacterota bacterium]|jgi:hypothetical protein
MDKLSLKSYGWKCVLGGEVVYFACMAYASLLTGSALALHNSLFELIPGFTWGDPTSIVWGAGFVFIVSWIFAWYYVWMHNSSLLKK